MLRPTTSRRALLGALTGVLLTLPACCCRPCCPRGGWGSAPAGSGTPGTPAAVVVVPTPTPIPGPGDLAPAKKPLDPPYFQRVRVRNAQPQPTPPPLIAANVAGYSRPNCTATATFPQQFPPPPSSVGTSYPIVDQPPLAVGEPPRMWPPTGTPVTSLPQQVRSVQLQLHVQGDANPCAVCIPSLPGKLLQAVDVDYVGKDGSGANQVAYTRTWYMEWDDVQKKWVTETDAQPIVATCVE